MKRAGGIRTVGALLLALCLDGMADAALEAGPAASTPAPRSSSAASVKVPPQATEASRIKRLPAKRRAAASRPKAAQSAAVNRPNTPPLDLGCTTAE